MRTSTATHFYRCVALMNAPGFDTAFRFEYDIVTQVAPGRKHADAHEIPFRNMVKMRRWETNQSGTRLLHVCWPDTA